MLVLLLAICACRSHDRPPPDAAGRPGIAGVITHDGQPLAGATVAVRIQDGDIVIGASGMTGSDGRFAVPCDVANAFEIDVTHPSGLSTARDLPRTPAPVRIDVGAAGAIHATVRSAGQALAYSPTRTRALDAPIEVPQYTDGGGAISLPPLEIGHTYRITATDVQRGVTRTLDVTLDAANPVRDVTLDL